MQQSPLGTLSARTFLRRHWQKRPLLVRQALPEFAAALGKSTLIRLSGRDDVESRLVIHRGGNWRLAHGPIGRAGVARLPRRDWTLLVQGVNLHVPAADRLLRRFDFLPQARLDDVMASYAAPGGGVGPHFDSYDVFLVQGAGRRIWRVSRKRPFLLEKDAPLKIIRNFEPDEEWLLEPGDLLYLPPGWGHDGVALGPCVTYSVGARAPRGAELAAAFLDFLQEKGFPDAEYQDPNLAFTRNSGFLSQGLIAFARKALGRIRWNGSDVENFLGTYLTTPKPQVVFRPPRRPLSPPAFARRLARAAVVLDERTQMLYRGAWLYVNGERRRCPGRAYAALADARRAARMRPGPLLYDWYRAGFLRLERA